MENGKYAASAWLFILLTKKNFVYRNFSQSRTLSTLYAAGFP